MAGPPSSSGHPATAPGCAAPPHTAVKTTTICTTPSTARPGGRVVEERVGEHDQQLADQQHRRRGARQRRRHGAASRAGAPSRARWRLRCASSSLACFFSSRRTSCATISRSLAATRTKFMQRDRDDDERPREVPVADHAVATRSPSRSGRRAEEARGTRSRRSLAPAAPRRAAAGPSRSPRPAAPGPGRQRPVRHQVATSGGSSPRVRAASDGRAALVVLVAVEATVGERRRRAAVHDVAVGVRGPQRRDGRVARVVLEGRPEVPGCALIHVATVPRSRP